MYETFNIAHEISKEGLSIENQAPVVQRGEGGLTQTLIIVRLV